jgi:hypothetical protein
VGAVLGGSWPFFIEGTNIQELLSNPARAAQILIDVNERVGADVITAGTGATA